MTKPTTAELERAHACMQAMLKGCRMAVAHGGKNAKMYVADVVTMIEAFHLGKAGEAEAAKEVQGPFFYPVVGGAHREN